MHPTCRYSSTRTLSLSERKRVRARALQLQKRRAQPQVRQLKSQPLSVCPPYPLANSSQTNLSASLPTTTDAALTSPTASPSSSSSSAADTGLSTGAKAGIGAGVGIAAVALLVGLLLFFLRRRRSASHGSAAHELPGGWGAEQKTRIELESARQAAELDSPQSFIAVPVDYSAPLTKQEERELAGKRRVAEVNGIGLQIPAGEFQGRNRERVELEAWRRQSKAVELGS
jgi:hypothetical protein